MRQFIINIPKETQNTYPETKKVHGKIVTFISLGDEGYTKVFFKPAITFYDHLSDEWEVSNDFLTDITEVALEDVL